MQDHDRPDRDALDASPRLFDNDLLDKLSRIDHRMPMFVYGPIIALLLIYSLSLYGVGLLLLGLLLGYTGWTLTEYFGHRYLFHTIFPLPFGLGPRFQFLIHGVHHIYPSDPLRLVMPPLLSAPIMLIAFSIISLIFSADFRWPVLAGFISGYVLYDFVHYWTHHSAPTSDFGKLVKRLHMLHHFRDPAKGFGVHAFWLDYVFGTAYEKDAPMGDKAL